MHRWPVFLTTSERPRHGGAFTQLLVAVALLLGTVALATPVVAAQGDGRFDYDQDGLVWSVSYDDGYWSEAGLSGAQFSVQGEPEMVGQGAPIVLFTITEDTFVGEDPAECIATSVEQFEGPGGANATERAAVENDDGEPIAGDTDDYAWAVRTITFDNAGIATNSDIVYACYALDDTSFLLGVGAVPAGNVEQRGETYTLFNGVAIDDEPVPLDLPDGPDDAAPTGDDEPAGSATPRAGDDATPVPDDGEETPTAGTTPDGASYTSPTYGYTLSYSADVWSVLEDLDTTESLTRRDLLSLADSDGTSILYIEGSEEWDDPDDCVAVLLNEIGIDPDVAEPLVDPATDEPHAIGEDDRSAAAFTRDVEGESGDVVLVDCWQDPDTDTIVGVTNVDSRGADDYLADQYPMIEAILETLTF